MMRWCLLAALLTGGCYLHHEGFAYDGVDASDRDADHGDGGPRDADHDGEVRVDAGDGSVHPDGSLPDGSLPDGSLPDGALPDARIDGGPHTRCIVPDVYPTLQSAFDDARCDVILIHGQVMQTGTAHTTRDVTIVPFDTQDAEVDAIHGDSTHSVISIGSNVHVTIEDVVIMSGGGERGGGIYSEGHLILRRTALYENRVGGSDARGGGLFQRAGSLFMDSALISQNRADNSTRAHGGGVYVENTEVQLVGRNLFVANISSADEFAFGGALAVSRSRVAIAGNAEFEQNRAGVRPTSAAGLAAAGAIYAFESDLTIRGALLLRNEASATGQQGSASAVGGAIGCEASHVDIEDVTADDNRAAAMIVVADRTASAGGGFLTGTRCDVLIRDATIKNNLVDAVSPDRATGLAGGGALHCTGGGEWQIERTLLEDNRAIGNVGGIAPSQSLSEPGSHARGGAIMNVGCDVSVRRSLVRSNLAMLNGGSTDPNSSADNACGGGVAMRDGDSAPRLLSVDTTWLSNRVEATSDGWALALGGAACIVSHGRAGLAAHFVNSTLSANTISAAHNAGGGGIVASATGSAVSISNFGSASLQVTFHNATIYGHEANLSPMLIEYESLNDDDDVRFANTIMRNTRADGSVDHQCYSYTPLSSGGFNFYNPDCFTTPQADQAGDPGIASIATGCGGDALCSVHPLTSSSAAVNAGNPNGCTDHNGDLITTDQRGLPRNGRCDVGAYELQP